MREEKVAHNDVGCHEFCVLYEVSEKSSACGGHYSLLIQLSCIDPLFTIG